MKILGKVNFILCFFTTISASLTSNAATQQEALHIGHATSVVKQVTAELSGQPTRKLIKADKIFFNENVITADGATLVIQFRDGSTFELGPDGIMTLDEMVFNPYEGTSEKVISLIQGSFRYISGFTSKNSQVTLNTTVATIGIRGSAASGFIYPGQPMFASVADGIATISNESGTTQVEPGEAIAVQDANTPPVQPENMPPAVTAQAMAHVAQTLGQSIGTVALTAEQKAADARANAIPILAQKQEGALTPKVALSAPVNQGGPTTPVAPLLSEAASVGLLSANISASTQTPEQQVFLAKAAAEVPNAAEIVQQFVAQDQAQHAANTQAGTTEVVAGASANVASATQVQALVRSAVGANASVAQIIASAVLQGSTQNAAIADTASLVQAAAKGAVQAASDTGGDIAAVTQAITQGIVQSSVESNLNAADIVQAVSSGIISASAETGGDVIAAAEAVAQAAVTAAAETDLNIAEITTAVLAGATEAAEETGSDLQAISNATQTGAIEGASEVGAETEVVTATQQNDILISTEETDPIDEAPIVDPEPNVSPN